MKQCTICGLMLPLSKFTLRKSPRTGKKYPRSECRDCRNKRGRDTRLVKLYGMTRTDYEAMYEAQGGACKLCGKKLPLLVDHCHRSSKVRGLLCNTCNVRLGWYENLPKGWLKRARDYIRG